MTQFVRLSEMITDEQNAYHWIGKAIDGLDPEKDYEKIWRLMTSYHLNDFMNNLIYSLTFPNFIITAHGAEAVFRDDGGKVVQKATHRIEETENTNFTWWFYGPSDPRCRKAIDGINKIHENWAKKYPGHFADNDDYIYTLAFSAILMHRLRLRVGLSGFTDKQKIAAHHFWRDCSYQFFIEGGKPVYDFPKDWDAAVQFCEEYENASRVSTKQGSMIAYANFEHFAFRYFPPYLRWLGRNIPVALSLPTTLKALQIKPVHPFWAALISYMMGLFLWLAEHLLPDPKVAFIENINNMTDAEYKQRRQEQAVIDKAFSAHFTQRYAQEWPQCPHQMLKTSN